MFFLLYFHLKLSFIFYNSINNRKPEGNMKKVFLFLFIALTSVFFSSCIILGGSYDRPETYENYGVVQIVKSSSDIQNNLDSYIESVEYYDNYEDEWIQVYKYSNSNTKCKFYIPVGRRNSVRCRIIYPKYDRYGRDYYADLLIESLNIRKYDNIYLSYDYYDSPIYRDGIDYSGYLYEIDNY